MIKYHVKVIKKIPPDKEIVEFDIELTQKEFNEPRKELIKVIAKQIIKER